MSTLHNQVEHPLREECVGRANADGPPLPDLSHTRPLRPHLRVPAQLYLQHPCPNTNQVNILVHATTDDPHAAAPRICGDRRGKCPDGQHGQYTWVRPGAVSGEDVYIREGMAALAGWQGACTHS